MPPPAVIALDTTGFPDRPGFGTAVARVLLDRVSAGDTPETFRISVPGRIVAFGKIDTVAPGYPDAVAAARRSGYAAVERLAGGRAAVFHPGTLAFAWTIPARSPRDGIRERFETVSGLMAAAFRRLGADARIGEVPGEYCPGAYSVNLAGLHKVMGVGQRLARHAAHVGGVVVVEDAAAVREALIPVYAALGLSWDPATAGALAGAVPGITTSDVVSAIITELGARAELRPAAPDVETLARAEMLLPDHVPAGVGAGHSGR